MIRTVCAWCPENGRPAKVLVDAPPAADGGVSHGICDECDASWGVVSTGTPDADDDDPQF